MRRSQLVLTCTVLFCSIGAKLALADGELHKVNHIIIVMQENHSFDNYFGVLAYAPARITTRTAPACQAIMPVLTLVMHS